ncbi:MAG TPA: hypothetical protein VI197_20140 [Polyangiaceae bacterium]
MSGSFAKHERSRIRATGALVVLGLFACSTGCSKESKPVAEDPKVPASSNSESAEGDSAKPEAARAPTDATGAPAEGVDAKGAEPAAAAGKSKVSEDSYDLKLEPSGTYKVGAASTVQIVLDAKAPFKVNQEYPYSFALNEAPGVQFASMKVAEGAVKLEQKRATMSVPFTPNQAGERTISGTFKFSVCTDEQCLIKKQELALAVTVE